MPVYHVALFKLKADADPNLVQKWRDVAQEMIAKVPGLLDLKAGPPLQWTMAMAKGYDMGAVATFDSSESLAAFFKDPNHEPSTELFKQVCEKGEVIAFDFEF